MKLLPLPPFLFSILFLNLSSVCAQEEKQIKLFVYMDEKSVSQFGVANLTNQTEGMYKDEFHMVKAKEGDELMIASNQFKNFFKLVTHEDIQKGQIDVYLKDGVIQLEEVVLTDRKLSYGTFTDYVPKVYTPAERRLATASKMYYKGSGMSLTLDPLINAISGRTKKLKKQLKAETSDLIVEFLEDNYKDYILNDLDVPREQFGLFCYFVSDQNKGIHKIAKKRRVEFILKRLYLEFVKDPAEE